MNPRSKEFYNFEQDLEEFLQNIGKLVILGIGNPLRGDDFLGSLLSRKLKDVLDSKKIVIIDGQTVPENFTGQIRKENPSHIIIIDAADMKTPPGYIKLISKDEISKYDISTHAMPLSFLIKYLEHTTDARIILIGIQPREMDLKEKISPEVYQSISYLIGLFTNNLNL